MTEKELKKIGEIIHYFDKISVAVVKVISSFKIGDKIKIKGATTDFEQKVKEMQIEHKSIDKTSKGQKIGLKVTDVVRPNDSVYVK